MGALLVKVGGTYQPVPQEAANPTGTIILFGAASAPSGYLVCNGQFVSQTTYSALFALVSHSFNNGVDPGNGTFKLPDLRDRTPVGASDTKGLGTTGGTELVTLTTDQLPIHNHSMQDHRHDVGHDHGAFWTGVGGAHDHNTQYNTVDGTNSNIIRTASLTGFSESTASNMVETPGSDHQHLIDVPWAGGNSGSPTAASTGNAGSGTQVNVQNKYQAINYCIKY